MRYADRLRTTFAGLDPVVDDLLLLEAHQVAGLPERAPARELAAVLHAHPRVRRYLATRAPEVEPYLDELTADHPAVDVADLAACEQEVLWELADWIVYERDPVRYDEVSAFPEALAAIAEVVDLDGAVVVDAGAGTGQVAFAVAPVARHVLAVEPVAALRTFMRRVAADRRLDHVRVADGFLDQLPLPPSSVDVVLTRRSIGWRLSGEVAEIERVVRPGGAAVHLVGTPTPDDGLHAGLVDAGYVPDTYTEAGQAGPARRYWRRFDP